MDCTLVNIHYTLLNICAVTTHGRNSQLLRFTYYSIPVVRSSSTGACEDSGADESRAAQIASHPLRVANRERMLDMTPLVKDARC
jgi:hypothetical protein